MSADSQPDWQEGTIVDTKPVARGTQRITIKRPPTRRAHPGTHIDVHVVIDGQKDVRSYSVVESNEDGSRITITVLLSPQSRGGSSYMHQLAIGDTLGTTQPLQNFALGHGAARYVLLAGGIGITAIIDMARVLKSRQVDYQLVYVARSRDLMAYLPELEQLHGDRLKVLVDDESTGLDIESFISTIATGPYRDGTELYMCGPIRLMDAVRRSWLSKGLAIYNLRYETFGNSGWFDATPFIARIPQLGIEAIVGANSTLLEALTAAGADMMYDCRKGECGLCLVDIETVDGQLDHRDVFLSDKQKKAGTSICICVSRVAARQTAESGSIPVLSLLLP